MLESVDEQVREVTRLRILGMAVREFVRLELDQADMNAMAAQAEIGKGIVDLPLTFLPLLLNGGSPITPRAHSRKELSV